MSKESSTKIKVINDHGPLGFVMFVAFIGAFVYFARSANDFGDFLWAFVQACVWPGIVVYHVLLGLGV